MLQWKHNHPQNTRENVLWRLYTERADRQIFISIDDTVLSKQCHRQRRNVQRKGPDGITPIWRERSSMGIRSMLPLLKPEISHCAIP